MYVCNRRDHTRPAENIHGTSISGFVPSHIVAIRRVVCKMSVAAIVYLYNTESIHLYNSRIFMMPTLCSLVASDVAVRTTSGDATTMTFVLQCMHWANRSLYPIKYTHAFVIFLLWLCHKPFAILVIDLTTFVMVASLKCLKSAK